jgi:hypothetical protein
MDMRSNITAFIVTCLLTLITGCTSLGSVPLDQSFWQEKGKRVGVALEVIGPPEVIMDISGGLGQVTHSSSIPIESPDAMEYPVQFHNTMPLYYASRALDGKAVELVLDLLVQGLKDRGLDAFKVKEHIDVKQLPRFTQGNGKGIHESKDLREISRSAGVDNFILIDLRHYGIICRYLDLNLFEVDVYADIRGEMIDAATNRALWRTGISDGYLTRTVDAANTHQPDQIKIIFDGLDKLLDEAAENISQMFFKQNQ